MTLRVRAFVAVVLLTAVTGCADADGAEKAAQEYASLDLSVLESNAKHVVDCVEKQTGFVVTAGKDGSVGYESKDVPDAQYTLVDEAIPKCFEDLGFSSSGELSESQRERIFGLQVEARKCLQDLGYATPEPPSLSTYVETYGGPDHWAPWRYMGEFQLNAEASLAVLEQCPDPVSLISW